VQPGEYSPRRQGVFFDKAIQVLRSDSKIVQQRVPLTGAPKPKMRLPCAWPRRDRPVLAFHLLDAPRKIVVCAEVVATFIILAWR